MVSIRERANTLNEEIERIANLDLVIFRLSKMPQILIWIWLTFEGVKLSF